MTKIFKFKTIDSTSIKAYELLNKKEKTPFFVIAEKQSKGRGSYSKTWTSPAGNLYLQLVQEYTPAHQKMLPQKIASLISNWIQIEFSLNVSIKWPNDLIFAGQKLAGILCEVHSFMSKKYLSLGIGINIFNNPDNKDFDYKTTCLNEYCTVSKNLNYLSESLIHYLDEELIRIDSKNFFTRMSEFLISENTLWQHKKTKEILFYKGLSPEGFMNLQDTKEPPQFHTINSAQNKYTWYYLDNKIFPKPILILEHVDETLKLSYFFDFRNQKPREQFLIPDKDQLNNIKKITNKIKDQCLVKIIPIFSLKVDNETLHFIEELKKQSEINYSVVTDRVRLIYENKNLQVNERTTALIEGYLGLKQSRELQQAKLIFLEQNQVTLVSISNYRIKKIQNTLVDDITNYLESKNDSSKITRFVSTHKEILDQYKNIGPIYFDPDLITKGIKTMATRGI